MEQRSFNSTSWANIIFSKINNNDSLGWIKKVQKTKWKKYLGMVQK
jgi:hypothetical protein